ncbi:DUF3037 domain-containing protein [Actinomadura sp. HBU206391]|uniref:DUF3037 domain-containing protein n=1 Tax=Actinomadura sp. HBU206391 TaxID=2731692 RepID=UPI00164EF8D6|nr:DUF3037 domain-containing protein [Actinomadura sp. HBU206391]MBC6462125.1 DUF3037 domain-containing protein [Actinomadura sp. HBU206391]
MDVYLYSVVRCMPDPRTGEFVNVAAIAGNPVAGDWSMRQVGDESRARRLADATALEAVHGFLAEAGAEIDENLERMEDIGESGLDEAWLQRLYRDHQDVVQLTRPTPILAEDAEQALEILFDRVVIDPGIEHREQSITRHRVLAELRDAYHRADISRDLVRPRVQVFVGGHVHTSVDFAVTGGDRVVQLAQGWSFQRTDLEELSVQVKAWGYVIDGLREGESARVIDSEDRSIPISRDVDVEIAFAQPRTSEQSEAFEEASEIFSRLGGHASELDDVDMVAERAVKLLYAGR